MTLPFTLSRRTLLMLAVLVPLLSLFAWVALRSGPLAPINVTVTRVEERSVAPALFGIGTVEARYTHKVGPTTAGRVTMLAVDVGDRVVAGQLLAQIDPIDLARGRGDAGITVFKQGGQHAGSTLKGSNGIYQYVNLALYQGFGLGLEGFDPLVLDLDGNGYDLIARDYSEVFFEFDNDGFAEHSGWIGGNDNGPVHERMAA